MSVVNSERFVEVNKVDFSKYAEKVQAAHCMIYAKCPGETFEGNDQRAAVLMQLRFDGTLGFPGGLIEKGEEVVQGLTRELCEEMNFDSKKYQITEDHHLVTQFDIQSQYLLHFYKYEIPYNDIKEVERRAQLSHDYGSEVLGTTRVPLYTMADGKRGFPLFLRNIFAGCSKKQLKLGLIKANIMNEEEIMAAEKVV